MLNSPVTPKPPKPHRSSGVRSGVPGARAIKHLRALTVGMRSRNTDKNSFKVGVMPKFLRHFMLGMVRSGLCSPESFLRRRFLVLHPTNGALVVFSPVTGTAWTWTQWRGFCHGLVLLLATLFCIPPLALAERPPNIVLMIGDDHGYPYFGFMGDENVVTPAMDALAAGGVTFSHGHSTAPYCRPSLRTLITGLHPIQYQLRLNEHVEALREQSDWATMTVAERAQWTTVNKANGMRAFDTLPKLLAQKGYVSWQGGKWWENSYRNGHFDEGMTAGWDMSLYGTDAFFHELMGAEGNKLVRETMDPLFAFIDRNASQPMFIWFGPMLPHTPLDAPYRFGKFYADKDISESAKLYYSNITRWDQGVSDLMDHIEAKGLLEDTVFIYLSDNGYEQDGDVEYVTDSATPSDELATGGFTGKGALYDLSVRTPIIFYWKGRLGASFNESSLVSSLDIAPTILDLVGIEAPSEFRGHSLKPLLEGENDRLDKRSALIGYSDNRRRRGQMMGSPAEGYYVRTHRWHFLWYADSDEMRLYDVTVDPRGERDLSAARPDLVGNFKQKIGMWKEDMGMPEAITIHE